MSKTTVEKDKWLRQMISQVNPDSIDDGAVKQELLRLSVDFSEPRRLEKELMDEFEARWAGAFTRNINFDLTPIIEDYGLSFLHDPTDVLNPVGNVTDEIHSMFHTGYAAFIPEATYYKALEELVDIGRQLIDLTIDKLISQIFGGLDYRSAVLRDDLEWEVLKRWSDVIILIVYQRRKRYDPWYKPTEADLVLYRHHSGRELTGTRTTNSHPVRRGQKALSLDPGLFRRPRY